MSKIAKEYLKHVLDEINFILEKSNKLNEEKFSKNETLKRAFCRSLEIIGEAIKNLPDEIKHNNKEVNWKSFAGLRDILIHNYFGVDYGIVWDIVVNELPGLKKNIEKIIL